MPNASSVSRANPAMLLWPMLTTLHLYKAKGYSLDSAYTANRIPSVIPRPNGSWTFLQGFLRVFHFGHIIYIYIYLEVEI